MNRKNINPFDVQIGDEVTVWHGEHGHYGQGGRVTSYTGAVMVLTGPDGQLHQFTQPEIKRIEVEMPYEASDCLDHSDKCRGPVADWYSGGLYGRTWPRCTRHGELRLAQAEANAELEYDVVPSWFDPSYAGESWDGE